MGVSLGVSGLELAEFLDTFCLFVSIFLGDQKDLPRVKQTDHLWTSKTNDVEAERTYLSIDNDRGNLPFASGAPESHTRER